MSYQVGEIWYVNFPLEEDPSQFICRPVIIAGVSLPDLVVIKVTKHKPRKKDIYDIPITHWREAGLKYPSTARISKVVVINQSQISNKKGDLFPLDYKTIFDELDKFIESNK